MHVGIYLKAREKLLKWKWPLYLHAGTFAHIFMTVVLSKATWTQAIWNLNAINQLSDQTIINYLFPCNRTFLVRVRHVRFTKVRKYVRFKHGTVRITLLPKCNYWENGLVEENIWRRCFLSSTTQAFLGCNQWHRGPDGCHLLGRRPLGPSRAKGLANSTPGANCQSQGSHSRSGFVKDNTGGSGLFQFSDNL